MKLYNQSFEILYQGDGPDGLKKHIEVCGRTCYKSQDKISEGSAEKFVGNMVKSNHGAMLEHGTVYMKIPKIYPDKALSGEYVMDFMNNKYSVVKTYNDDPNIYVTTNYRTIIENHLEKAMEKYGCDYIVDKHERRITIKFVTNLQVSHELVRHRTMSFAQESSRYCNYNKEKFGGEIGFIIPSWLDKEKLKIYSANTIGGGDEESNWVNAMKYMQNAYMSSINVGMKAQQAAQYLPKATKTEVIVTGTVSQWKTLLDMRALGSTGAPHPQMVELMLPVYKTFRELNIIPKSIYEKS